MTTALGRCVGDVGSFLSDHWSRAPLHRPAPDGGDGFAGLLSLADVDHLVSSSLPRSPTFRLVRDGTPLDPARYTRTTTLGGRPVPGVGHPGLIWQEFEAGATIVLQALHRHWLPLARFCRSLEQDLTHPVQANAYVTPAAAQGLAVHHDTHDVFVLQVGGRKRWSVHTPVVELPLRSQPWSSSMGPAADPLLDLELAPGDCLYIPRGFPHAARAQEGVSAHVTIGVLTWTGDDVVRDVVRDAAGHLPLRRPLPVGFARDEKVLTEAVADALEELRGWLATVDPADVARRMTRRFWSSRPAILAGQLAQLGHLAQLDDTTVVRRRPGATCHLAPARDRLEVVLADRTVALPAALEPVVRQLTGGPSLAVGDLAAALDGPSRLVLVRRLVREGLLEIVPPE
jgi:lysine-specific demethylase/histidyl-hydroxylase NO66